MISMNAAKEFSWQESYKMIINENNATCCLGDVAKLFSSFLAKKGRKGRTPSLLPP